MNIYTDNLQFAENFLPEAPRWQNRPVSGLDENIRPLAERLFPGAAFLGNAATEDDLWNHLFIVRHTAESQFDILTELGREHPDLPHAILCLAGAGKKMHGFRSRPWVSLQGNLHISAYLSPQQPVAFFHTGFTILSAVSVVQTIDTLNGLPGKASIKWVNDILLNGSKVSGVIAHTLTQGQNVAGAVLGIGINVETTPLVPRHPFVPGVISLRDVLPDPEECNLRIAFNRLTSCLMDNYRKLIAGRYSELLDFYRGRSIIIGKEAVIYSDQAGGISGEIARGKISAIGENLELYLEGSSIPITRGRLVLR